MPPTPDAAKLDANALADELEKLHGMNYWKVATEMMRMRPAIIALLRRAVAITPPAKKPSKKGRQ